MTLFESPQQLKSVAGKRIGNYNGIRYYRMRNKHRGRWSGWPIIRILVTGSGQWSLESAMGEEVSWLLRDTGRRPFQIIFFLSDRKREKELLNYFRFNFPSRKKLFHAVYLIWNLEAKNRLYVIKWTLGKVFAYIFIMQLSIYFFNKLYILFFNY